MTDIAAYKFENCSLARPGILGTSINPIDSEAVRECKVDIVLQLAAKAER